MHYGRTGKRLAGDERGAAIIEMALALPVLVSLFCGIVSYGTLFSLHHAVQQSANEASRAALAGLSQSERYQIAEDVARSTLASSYSVRAQDVQTATTDNGQSLTVTVTYNAAGNPLLNMPLIPKPSTQIQRRASVRLTGL